MIPTKPAQQPRVRKEKEFTLMCEFIELGLWRTANLVKAVGVDRETITEWKRLPQAQTAYQKAIKDVINKRKKVGDPEKIMKELNLEVDADKLELAGGLSIYSQMSDDQLDSAIKQKTREAGITPTT